MGLRQYVMSFSRNAGLRTELVISSEIEKEKLGEAVETQLQRIIQEALINIRKHAGARSARVIFALDGGQVNIMIEDDGRGFVPADLGNDHGFGLRAMAGRAEAAGARFEIQSTPGKGTRIRVCVPWRRRGEP
jgi:signal transduction histidine kinase